MQGRLIHDIVISKLAGYTREAKYRAVGMLRQLSENFMVGLLMPLSDMLYVNLSMQQQIFFFGVARQERCGESK